jgi:Flp pilus assembly protein TadD
LRRPEVSADDPETHVRLDLARDHQARGDLKEAEQSYRSLLEENWSNAEAHAGLGRLLARLGDLQEGEAHLQRAVLLEPQDTRTRLDLAAVQIWLVRYPSARQQLQAVVDADPTGVHADGARTLLQLVDALDAPG